MVVESQFLPIPAITHTHTHTCMHTHTHTHMHAHTHTHSHTHTDSTDDLVAVVRKELEKKEAEPQVQGRQLQLLASLIENVSEPSNQLLAKLNCGPKCEGEGGGSSWVPAERTRNHCLCKSNLVKVPSGIAPGYMSCRYPLLLTSKLELPL